MSIEASNLTYPLHDILTIRSQLDSLATIAIANDLCRDTFSNQGTLGTKRPQLTLTVSHFVKSGSAADIDLQAP
jgi:hypothetical protein